MKLSLRDIGKIKSADIELNGITVLAGENNSGKSTVGKVLFAMVNSLHRNKEQVRYQRHVDMNRPIIRLLRSVEIINSLELDYEDDNSDLLSLALDDEVIIADVSELKNDKDGLMAKLMVFLEKIDYDSPKEVDQVLLGHVASQIIQSLDLTNEEIAERIVQHLIFTEMDGQVNNLLSPESMGSIEFTHNDVSTVLCMHNDVIYAERALDIPSITSHAIYIESPYVSLDGASRRVLTLKGSLSNYGESHQIQLQQLLRNAVEMKKNAVSELVNEKKLSQIFSMLNETPTGELRRGDRGRIQHFDNKTNTSYNLNNVSTGIKSFLVIKTLLLGDALNYDDVLILDEPEVHLHPQWQLVFAELLILLQKELGLHILISTHSATFLDAIEVYSKKHGIKDKCKYYLAENQNNAAVITDVTENVDKIYEKLLAPILVLEDEENGYE